jgi:aminotransferase
MDISELNIPSEQFCDLLLEREKVALVPGVSFGKHGENYVRVTCVKSWDEINKGLEGISSFVQNL